MLWEIFKYLGLLLILFVAYKYAKALRRQKEWEAQGVVFSGPFAYFTDFIRMIQFSETHKHEMILVPLISRFEKNCQLPEAIGLHFMGTTGVILTRAKQVEEVFMTKNAFYSKHEIERQLS